MILVLTGQALFIAEFYYFEIIKSAMMIRQIPNTYLQNSKKTITKTIKPKHTPLNPKPKIYDKAAQNTEPLNESQPATKDEQKRIEKNVGSFQ